MRRASLLLGVVVCLSIVLLSVAATSAQQEESGREIRIQTNVLCFNDPSLDSLALVEFPFTLNRHDFEFAPVQDEDGNTTWRANIHVQVKLFNTLGYPIDSAATSFGVVAKTQEESRREGIKLFNTLKMVVKPGIYTAHMEVYDLNNNAVGQSFFDKVLVESIDRRKLTIAGAGFAYHIAPVSDPETARRDPNVRNGYRVLSNPLGVFKATDTVAFLSAEIYNLSDSAAPKALDMSFRILGAGDNLVQDFGHKIMDIPGPSVVIAESFDLIGIGHGLYTLEVIAHDLTADKADTTSIPLRIVDPAVAAAYAESVEDDISDDMSLEKEMDLVYHLLEPNQLQQLRSLNPNGKRAFLDRFWRVQAVSTGLTLEEYRDTIKTRFDYTNKWFSNSLTEGDDGWLSDRGRIYIQYGPPEEIVDIQTPVDGDPFVVWYYHSVREGTVFVFSDEDNDHEYRLVHSNAEKERYDYDWDLTLQREIYKLY